MFLSFFDDDRRRICNYSDINCPCVSSFFPSRSMLSYGCFITGNDASPVITLSPFFQFLAPQFVLFPPFLDTASLYDPPRCPFFIPLQWTPAYASFASLYYMCHILPLPLSPFFCFFPRCLSFLSHLISSLGLPLAHLVPTHPHSTRLPIPSQLPLFSNYNLQLIQR